LEFSQRCRNKLDTKAAVGRQRLVVLTGSEKMNTGSDDMLVRAEDKVEVTRQEKMEQDAALVELGKVSDTRGGFFGFKPDTGAGLSMF
jgi:hypothetical protein